MSCNSSTCQKTAVVESAELEEAAGRLAFLLADEPVFQNFIHLAHQVRHDGEVVALVNTINEQAYAANPFTGEGGDTQELEERLEAMPIVREYRAAEVAVRALFRAVDQAISSAAGVAFAENARSCGHG